MNLRINSNRDILEKALDEQLEAALEAIGIEAERQAKVYLTNNGSVDTGLLRNSITHAVSGQAPKLTSYKADRGDAIGGYSGLVDDDDVKAMYLGTNVEYAAYVELGTSRTAAKPYIRPAVENHVQTYKTIAMAYLTGEN